MPKRHRKQKRTNKKQKQARGLDYSSALTIGGVDLSLLSSGDLSFGGSTTQSDSSFFDGMESSDDLSWAEELGPTPEAAPQVGDIGLHIEALEGAALEYSGETQGKVMAALYEYRDAVELGEFHPGHERLLRKTAARLRSLAKSKHKKKTRDPAWDAFRQAALAAADTLDTELALLPGQLRLQEMLETGELEDGGFHGTHTGLLNGLEAGGSDTILPAAELVRRGIIRTSGEGDFFSAGGEGEKEFVSIGIGELGLGTALSYALASGSLENYTTEVYTDAQLKEEYAQIVAILKNWDEDLLEVEDNDRKTVEQFEALRGKLEWELEHRADLPPDHPRRQGRLATDSSCPLFLQFDVDGLDVRDDGGLGAGERTRAEGGFFGDLPGERMVYGNDGIDLSQRLVRAWAPLARMEEIGSRLAGIVGHSAFELLPIETLSRAPVGTWLRGAQVETSMQLGEFEAVRRSILTAYAERLSAGEPVTTDDVIRWFSAMR